MSITEFLLARIADDEAKADDISAGHEGDRIRAEATAKRGVIRELAHDFSEDARYTERAVLSHLATVYADHPEFQHEWAM